MRLRLRGALYGRALSDLAIVCSGLSVLFAGACGSVKQPASFDERMVVLAQGAEMWVTRSSWETLRTLGGPKLSIPVSGVSSQEDAALRFLTDETALFGMPAGAVSLEVVSSERIAETDETVVRIAQRIGGQPVWNAGATVRVGQDATIRQLTSTLLPMSALWPLPPAGDLAAAERAALQAVSGTVVTAREEGIWVEMNTTSPRVVRASRITLSSGGSQADHIVYVGAKEEILAQQQLAQGAKHVSVYSWLWPNWTFQYDDICHASCPAGADGCTVCPAGFCASGACANPNPWNGTSATAKANIDQIYNYYLSNHKRDSWNGSGGLIWLRTDYGSGCDGTWFNADNRLEIGGAAGQCLDLLAHEYTHGIDDGYLGILYATNLSEGVPDVMAQFVERAAYGTTDWVFTGTQYCPSSCGWDSRSLRDPESQGASGNYAAAYLDTYSMARVLGKAGYLMGREPIEGAETYWGVTVQGVGAANAEKIWYGAVFACLAPNSTLHDLRSCLTNTACSGAYSATVCSGARDALDAIGLFRADTSAGFNVTAEVALAKISGAATDDYYMFHQDPGSSLGGSYVWYRKRTCSKTGTCSAAWSAPSGYGPTYLWAPAAAAQGGYVYVAGSQTYPTVLLERFNPANGTRQQLFNWGARRVDGRLSMVEYNGDIYIFFKEEGASATSIWGLRYQPATNAWSWISTPILSALPPTAISGTMDGMGADPAKGLWVVYYVDGTTGFAYRRYDPTTNTWSSETAAGTTQTAGAAAAAIWRGRIHLAGRTATGQVFHQSCALPCASTTSWTTFRQHEPSSADGLVLFGNTPGLELWHRPAGSNALQLRLKYGD